MPRSAPTPAKPRSRRLKTTPEMEERVRKAIAEEEQPDVMAANIAKGRELLREREQQQLAAAQAMAQRVLSLLRIRRQKLDLSLSDLQERTGIHRSNLSRLLSDEQESNVTLATVARLAEAMECEIDVSLVERKRGRRPGPG